MKRASSRPHQLKEQLLQAIDAQNNIQNMMAVLDVICCLESFPMTKEALVETRLGKLINDVRKRSTDEDLVQRLKNLIRRWQTLVGANEVAAKEISSFAINSTSAECVSRATQTLSENYSRSLLHSNMSERAETSQGSVPDKTTNYPNRFRKSKIPVRAIKPYSSTITRLQQTASLKTTRRSQNEHNIRERNGSSASHSDAKHFLASEAAARPISSCAASDLPKSSIPDSNTQMHQSSDLLNILRPAALNENVDEVSSTVSERALEDKTKTNQQNGHTVKLDGEDGTKTDRLAYDPHAQQIKPVSGKTFRKDSQRSTGCEIQSSGDLKHSLRFFLQTNRREISLTAENSGMSSPVGGRIAEFPVTELPGVSREVSERDLVRIRRQRWHGVNGCYDNRNNWYDWTQSITLDPYGDGSKLKILPYVGVDYRL
ncbi:mediator of RNA polymerase II transcription subunit 26 isoform X2 [Labeo rohita]|uniref:mediator of RNA polymerase II transcription subunit 26 isoform X2 n=1 Tax=Labeo rohita TaxID=84645 RepID=UPI0021E29BFD|nr:mediator of RNA polymerase II transcription subunit 26 isoform X2 [Labeo rohita]